jgi:hypothetical protein
MQYPDVKIRTNTESYDRERKGDEDGGGERSAVTTKSC